MKCLILFSLILVSLSVVTPASSKEMGFDIIQDNASVIVVADGGITADTPMVFKKFLEENILDGSFKFMALSSPGGSLSGGMELGRMIRKIGLITTVNSYPPRREDEEYWMPNAKPGICVSACALAYTGGKDRWLSEDSILGFHQFYSAANDPNELASVSKTEAETQQVSGFVYDYIAAMGVSTVLFSKMSNTLPDEMYIPKPLELRELNIIQAKAFSNFVLEPYGDGVIAYSIFPRNVKGSVIVSQVSFYCRKGTPFILFSQPKHFKPLNVNWLKMVGEAVTGFSLCSPDSKHDVEYPKSNISLRIGGQPLAEIRIDQRGVDILMMGARGNVTGIYSALNSFLSFTIEPTEPDKRVLQAAFRLCID